MFDIAELDAVIHGRVRLGVMAYLASAQTAYFTELKQVLQATDGNLSAAVRKLEEAGYVGSERSIVDRRPMTRYAMTDAGRKAFAHYLDVIGRLAG